MGSAVKGVGGFLEDATGINLGNSSQADQAVKAQKRAADQANATQLQMYSQTRDDLSPYTQAGVAPLNSLATNDFMNNWQVDPGYRFRLNEGMKALQGSAAAKGNLNSGATMKALTRYGQDFASNEYGNIYNREYNRLSNLVNIGQNSAAQTGAAGQNYANAYGQNITGAANAQAAAAIGQANQTSGLIGSGLTAGALYLGGK